MLESIASVVDMWRGFDANEATADDGEGKGDEKLSSSDSLSDSNELGSMLGSVKNEKRGTL